MQGRTAVFHTMGDVAAPTQKRNIASNVFTSPEIASVGWSENDIREGLTQGHIQKILLSTNPRAKMQGIQEGFIKLFARTGSGTVLGGVVVSPIASELIYPIAIAVENRLTVDELARTYTVYPSLTGTITDAARSLYTPNMD
jgi:dihydrolipoamide dehydrogenase